MYISIYVPGLTSNKNLCQWMINGPRIVQYDLIVYQPMYGYTIVSSFICRQNQSWCTCTCIIMPQSFMKGSFVWFFKSNFTRITVIKTSYCYGSVFYIYMILIHLDSLQIKEIGIGIQNILHHHLLIWFGWLCYDCEYISKKITFSICIFLAFPYSPARGPDNGEHPWQEWRTPAIYH